MEKTKRHITKLPNKITINGEEYVRMEAIYELEKRETAPYTEADTYDLDEHDKFISDISISDFVDCITALN